MSEQTPGTESAAPASVPLASERSPARGRLGGWLRLVFSVGVLGWLIAHTEWTPLLETLGGVRLDLCVAALFIYCCVQVPMSSYRWMLLAHALGFAEKYVRYFALFYVGMFFNLFMPTAVGGDVVRAWLLGARPGRRWLAALSVVSERATGLMALLLIACIATFIEPDAVPAWADWLVWGLTTCGILGFATLPILGRWSGKCRSLASSLSLYRGHRRRWALAMLLSFGVQATSVLMVWLLGLSLGLDVSLLSYAVVVPLVSLFTMLPISVNGVGIREGGLVLLLAPAGVPAAAAVALGLLWFWVQAGGSVIGGAVYLLGGIRGQESGVRGQEDDYGPVSDHPDQGREGQPAAAA